jgi:hypothetical protein
MSNPLSLSRLQFLRGALGFTGAALGAHLLAPGAALAEPTPTPTPTPSPVRRPLSPRDRPWLALDGVVQGSLGDTRGGGISVTPVASPGDAAFWHAEPPTYLPLELAVGFDMGPNLYSLMRNRLMNSGSSDVAGAVYRPNKVSGQVIERTFNGKLRTATFPAMDTTQGADGFVTLEFAPTAVEDRNRKTLPFTPPQPSTPWRTSDFKLDIAGMDASAVTAVEAFKLWFSARAPSRTSPPWR